MTNTPTRRVDDHERIWLQPECCGGEEGRLWCEDNAPEDCPDGALWTEYVRADILRKALEWYDATGGHGQHGKQADWVRKAREILGEDE